jgi:PAS domain S-box-containing protein
MRSSAANSDGRTNRQKPAKSSRPTVIASDDRERDRLGRRFREALRQSERRFAAIFDNAFQFIGLLDPDGTVLEANRAALGLGRLKLADVVGRKFWDAPWWPATEVDRERLRAAVGQAAAGRFVRYEVDVRAAGGPRTIDFSLQPVKDAAGRVALLIPEGRDITERRRVERELAQSREKLRRAHDELEARVRERTAELSRANATLKAEVAQREQAERSLRESEAQARAVLDTAVDAIVTIDALGIVQSFNPAAKRLFGYRASEVLGRNVSMLMPSPDAERHDGYLANYLRTGRAKIIGIGREVVGLRKDGSTFPVNLAVSEVNLGGRRTFTGILRDLTEQKRLEKEILEIAEREQRRIGQDLHDGLGQQLTGIAYLAQTLQHRLASKNRPEAAGAGEVTGLLGQAIDQARALSRGLHPVEPKPEGLPDALRSLAVDVSTVFNIRCLFRVSSVTGGGGLAAPIGDQLTATHLYRIAQEAVNNAIRHGKAKRVRITLKSSTHGGTMLSVEDNGVGLPPPPPGKSPHSADSGVWTGRGMGLRTMSHRAHLIGATLEIGRSRTGGVKVVCRSNARPPGNDR